MSDVAKSVNRAFGLAQELEMLNAARTPGYWEAVDEVRAHHHFKFLRAPQTIVENTRGPSFAQEILADEDYDTKSADLKFIAFCATNAEEIIRLMRGEQG